MCHTSNNRGNNVLFWAQHPASRHNLIFRFCPCAVLYQGSVPLQTSLHNSIWGMQTRWVLFVWKANQQLVLFKSVTCFMVLHRRDLISCLKQLIPSCFLDYGTSLIKDGCYILLKCWSSTSSAWVDVSQKQSFNFFFNCMVSNETLLNVLPVFQTSSSLLSVFLQSTS